MKNTQLLVYENKKQDCREWGWAAGVRAGRVGCRWEDVFKLS